MSDAIWAITDGNQRRVTGFGNIRNNTSYILIRSQTLPKSEPGTPTGFHVVLGTQHQTVSSPVGAISVSASSFGSTILTNDPGEGPTSAFDGNSYTSWVADATQHAELRADEYVAAHQVRSVLALPIRYQAKTIGLLYLENNLATRAFTPDRVRILQLLSSQVAIAPQTPRS